MDSLLGMVRQDRLELLASPTLTDVEMYEARAVANFITELKTTICPNLEFLGDQMLDAKARSAAGLDPKGVETGNPYMAMSPDLN